MPNDVKLQSPEGKHPLDENLRPVKIGNLTSPLELSNNVARVNGDLEITGEIPIVPTNSIRTSDKNKSLNISSGRGLELHSATGDFSMIQGETEFSVTDSAFAGMILGYTTVGIDATADSYDLTATMTVPDDAMKVKFIAPP